MYFSYLCYNILMDTTGGGNNQGRSAAAEAARQKVLAVYKNTLRSLEESEATPAKTEEAYPAPAPIYSNTEALSQDYPQPGGASSSAYPNPANYQENYNTLAQTDFAEMNNEPADDFDDYDEYDQYDEYDNLDQHDYSEPPAYQNYQNYQNYQATPAAEAGALKDLPVNQASVDANWQQYHSAWQQYYQKYYSDYYAQAAQNYLATEKMKTERIATGKIHRKKRHRKLIPLAIVAVIVLGILFLQYNRLIFAPIMAYVSPDTGSVATSIEPVDPTVSQEVSPEPRLIIPKLNIDVPVDFDVHYNDIMEAMNHGVARFSISGADALPGQIGNLVISGHSAGDIYSSNPYKFIFSGLERMNTGDLIYINYNSVRYTYQVTGSEVVDPSNVQALIYPTDKPMLTLVTCTPLGTSKYRLLLSATQINPAYESSSEPQPENPAEDPAGQPTDSPSGSDMNMPANSPSFFERIWQKIFGGE